MSLHDDIGALDDLCSEIADAGCEVVAIDAIQDVHDPTRVKMTVTLDQSGGEDDESKSYEPVGIPDEYSTGEVREGKTSNCTMRVTVPSPVCDWFDTDRFHVREREGRVEFAPGEGASRWPDYQADGGNSGIGSSRVREEMLDVVPGDKVHYKADGDVVVATPERIAERDEPDMVALSDVCEQLPDRRAEVLEVLADEGECPSKEISLETGASDYLSQILAALKDEGYIDSRKNPKDGRQYLYSLADHIEVVDAEQQQAEAVFGDGGESG